MALLPPPAEVEEESRRDEKEEEEDEQEDGGGVVTLELDEEASFDLEKAVCSHGLFMMAPNRWEPSTKTLTRPLRVDTSHSLLVSISQPKPSLLRISVPSSSLSPPHRHSISAQVRRMLRLSDEEGRMLREFHKIHPAAAAEGLGRIFRSPMLFEDMVKCILLCNCQWSRTLSMARALCELQLELKNNKHIPSFQPRTPQKKDSKKKLSKKRKVPMRLDNEVSFGDREVLVSMTSAGENINLSSQIEKEGEEKVPQLYGLDSGIGFSSGRQLPNATCEIGNFPCPEELANLSEEFLTKRCGLGYRARRILSLARDVVENKIHLREFEEVCNVSSYERYNILSQKLLAIDGFGPFTCTNVLMCMGYYHKIPCDSETIRHLKQVHSRNCTMRTIDRDLEQIYGKYAPFQFLAYWIELWAFYETRFGKTSEMAWSDYQLITASNMKAKNSI